MFFSCGNGKEEHEDADTDLDGELEGDPPVDDDADDDELLPRPCAADSDCTDGDPCNGNEHCDPETLLCAAGQIQPDGAICSLDPRRICLSGACSASLCGDGFLDPGGEEFCEPPGEGDCDDACLLICEGDPDCQSDGLLCNGQEYCNLDTSRCSRRDRPEDGRACSLDPRGICLGGICTDSLCGDGFLDAGGGEFCEPPYDGDCDYDCALLCGGDPDCLDDADPCNGIEYCSVDTDRCGRQNPAPTGTVCLDDPRSICLAGLCRESICGDGFLDEAGGGEFCEPPYSDTCDGDCRLLCGGDPDCLDDGEICNGAEYCDLDTSRCGRRDVPPAGTACDDGNPETTPDLCDGLGACIGEIECVPGSFVSVAAGNWHTCALLLAGAVQCWGYNLSGQLGDGTTTDRLTPVDVTGLASGMGSVATGYWHSCALPSAGGMVCWGENGSGQLGDGSLVNMTEPVNVAGLAATPSAVTAGRGHTCALLPSGGIQCWGNNRYGQLGDGSTTRRTSPVNVTGLASAAATVAAGDFYTCAVLVSGAVQCWGINESGQLGNGTTTDSPVPVSVTGLASGVSAVTAGEEHTCALLDSGGVRCWGMGGLLGDGTTVDRTTPVDVTGLSSSATAVDADSRHTCALLDTGGVQCWGQNGSGQLGDGTTTSRLTAADVTGLSSGVAALAAGADHTCAVTDAGGVLCWGLNNYGQLGDGTTTSRLLPADVIPCP